MSREKTPLESFQDEAYPPALVPKFNPSLSGTVSLDLSTALLGVERLRRRKGGNAGVILEMLLELIGSDALTRETRLARREAGEV
jgi:hypothetical protein